MVPFRVCTEDEDIESVFQNYKNCITINETKGELHYKELPILFARAELLYNLSEEMRRIIGESRPSFEDVTTRKFDNAVAKPYKHRGLWIPYGCLIPKKIDNLLVAGRCISTQDDAHPPLCTIPPCISAGQAAGTAAALALEKGVIPRELDVPLLQKTIGRQGMDLE